MIESAPVDIDVENESSADDSTGYPDSTPISEVLAESEPDLQELLAEAFGEDHSPLASTELAERIKSSPGKRQGDHGDVRGGSVMNAPYLFDMMKSRYGDDWPGSVAFRRDLITLKQGLDAGNDRYGPIAQNLGSLTPDPAKLDPKARRQRAAGLYQILVQGVKYIDERRRRRYQIFFRNGAMLRQKTRQDKTLQPFSTKACIDKALGSGKWVNTSGERCLFVMVQNSSQEVAFYSHVQKRGRFHHSSLNAGREVASAGEWETDSNGVLVRIWGQSGHYQPEKWRTLWVLRELNSAGALGDAQVECTIKLPGKSAPTKEFLPAIDVLNKFTSKQMEAVEFY